MLYYIILYSRQTKTIYCTTLLNSPSIQWKTIIELELKSKIKAKGNNNNIEIHTNYAYCRLQFCFIYLDVQMVKVASSAVIVHRYQRRGYSGVVKRRNVANYIIFQFHRLPREF